MNILRKALRIAYGPVLAWAIISAAVLVFTDPARAEPVGPGDRQAYSAQLARERDALLRVFAQTGRCMTDAADAGARQGVTQEHQLTQFVASMCGAQLKIFLMHFSRWSEDDANKLVVELSNQRARESLRWGKP